jgi:hypothetical protein
VAAAAAAAELMVVLEGIYVTSLCRVHDSRWQGWLACCALSTHPQYIYLWPALCRICNIQHNTWQQTLYHCATLAQYVCAWERSACRSGSYCAFAGLLAASSQPILLHVCLWARLPWQG